MSKKKKIWLSVGGGLIVIVSALIIIYFTNFRTTDVTGENPEDMEILVQKITEEQLDETILVTGKIVPENEQKVYPDTENGEIKEFKVKENAKVKAGDVLFVYDGSKLDNDYNAAVRSRDMLQNSINSEQNQINQLANQIEQMKKDKNKSQPTPKKEDSEDDMVEESPITAEDIRELELQKNQLQLELENTKAEMVTAQSEINEIDKQKQALSVKSKINGTVVKVNKNVEKTEEGTTEPVVHIVSNKPFNVIGTMSEFDAVKIKPKQEVTIRPKVYKDREWSGTVTSVSQFPNDDTTGGDMDMYMEEDTNVTMYPFTVGITDDTKDLRQGFHVSLEVNLGGDKKIAVPHMAIMDDMMMDMEDEDPDMMDDMFGMDDGFMEEGASFVYVLVDGVLERRDIETGNMNDEFVEIIDGVELDELVVITPTPEMFDGMEVTSYDEVE